MILVIYQGSMSAKHDNEFYLLLFIYPWKIIKMFYDIDYDIDILVYYILCI